jgi:NAD(P)-dependent dehydrogenase (short-subunit alcohol dehydrogenase family)
MSAADADRPSSRSSSSVKPPRTWMMAGSAEEIAPTVVYMASDASAFMTGSVVVIDGGYTIH